MQLPNFKSVHSSSGTVSYIIDIGILNAKIYNEACYRKHFTKLEILLESHSQFNDNTAQCLRAAVGV